MRFLIFLFPAILLGGCASPYYFVAFSNGYDPATSYTHSLPAIVLEPGQTRKACVPARDMPFSKTAGVASENPAVVLVWEPANANDIVRIQAIAPGSTLVHRGVFPFPTWKPGANPLQRSAWRAALRKYLRSRPENDAAFRAISDEELWKTVVRSRSEGALRVVVEEDRLKFQ